MISDKGIRTKCSKMAFLWMIIISAASTVSAGQVDMQQSAPQAELYDVFFESPNYRYSLYEPRKACYIGADISTSQNKPMSISEFEQLTEKSHGIYLNVMRADEPFPINWANGCAEESRIPCIVIEPVSRSISQTSRYLDALAAQLGEYYMPMLVQFMPVSLDYDRDEYIRVFREASEIFKKKASNVALVFTVNEFDALDPLAYYPGNEYVDWVGLNIRQTINKDGNYSYDSLKVLDMFYFTFQKDKPIMISGLAISHFSNTDHIYRNSMAATEIGRIYKAVAEDYPRVKCLIYRNINSVNTGLSDNFSVTDSRDMLSAYKIGISNSHFTSDILLSSGEIGTELMKSPFSALKVPDGLYISANTLRYDLGIVGLSAFNATMEANGLSYYRSDILISTYRNVTTDIDKKHAFIVRGK